MESFMLSRSTIAHIFPPTCLPLISIAIKTSLSRRGQSAYRMRTDWIPHHQHLQIGSAIVPRRSRHITPAVTLCANGCRTVRERTERGAWKGLLAKRVYLCEIKTSCIFRSCTEAGWVIWKKRIKTNSMLISIIWALELKSVNSGAWLWNLFKP